MTIPFALHRHRPLLAALVTAALALAGCGNDDATESASTALSAVAGTLTYPEPIPLSDNAVVEVELADVSTGGEAVVVATQRIRNPGQVPIHFRLDYPATAIDAARRYTVQARIREGERLAFATDTAYPVITQGNPRQVDVIVVPIGGPDGGVTAAADTAADRLLRGELTSGDSVSRYTAQYRDGTLVTIRESVDRGVSGRTDAEYQFKEGRLLRYVEVGSAEMDGRLRQVEFDLAFDETGELLAARSMVDGAAREPARADIDRARNRADLLRSHAAALRSVRDHGH